MIDSDDPGKEETKARYASARENFWLSCLMAIVVAIGIAVFATRKLTMEYMRRTRKMAIRKP